MAMLEHHAVATVVSAQVLSYDEASILVEAGGINPVNWFLSNGEAAEDEEEDNRPKKRRKTKPADEVIPDTALPSSERIVLRRAAIDLHFPESIRSTTPSAKAVKQESDFEGSTSITVLLKDIDVFEDGTRLKLAAKKKKSPILVVDTNSIEPETLRYFRRMIQSCGSAKAEAAEHPATFTHCTVRRSHGLHTIVRLEATLCWRSGASGFPQGVPTGKARVYPDYENLAGSFPGPNMMEPSSEPWTPQDFYESVHVPDKDQDTKSHFDGLLDSELYPFQKRAVHWLLQREGVEYRDKAVHQIPKSERGFDLKLCAQDHDLDGRKCYVNHLQGILQKEAPLSNPSVSGGILAEEMGLGKTVELMALLSLHRRPEEMPDHVFDHEHNMQLRPSRATLIITPNTILAQWKSELSKHAPALKVHEYTGVSTQDKRDEGRILDELANHYDVVLATYQTLSREVHFAEDPPDRAMRYEREYERKRSPLVRIQWWRLCLDEAQMVESGVTAAARVARRLPRVHSWAVSGTPVRKNVQDLHGLLIFLQFEPLCDDARLWSHLITNHRYLFRELFGNIALRHTKAQIREDLHIPPQKRVVITVPFSAIELQQYTTLFKQMCDSVGVTSEGAPRNGEWDPNDPATIEQMRTWLVRLRQTCLHPQVGGKNRKALGRGQGPLRTVGEVLAAMLDNNEVAMRTEERALLATQLQHAHILGNAADNEHRSEEALRIYLTAMEASDVLVKDARRKLAAAKETQAKQGDAVIDTDDEDSSTESAPELGRLRNSVRTAVHLQHQCIFFVATAYYNIKTNEALTPPESEKFQELENREVELYDRAKLLRKEVLRDAFHKSENLMRSIKDKQTKQTFTKMPKIKDLDSLGGIECQRIVEKSDYLFDVIKAQARTVDEWRTKMAEYLIKPLVDEDEGIETTGEEYEESTKLQDELYAYFDAVKALQADMNTYITGEDAPLIDHEVKTTIRAAKRFLDPETHEDMKGFVHAPELTLVLLELRNKYRSKKEQIGSVRGLIQEARTLETSVGVGARHAEAAIAHKHLTALQTIFSAYSKALAGFDKEVELFRQTQNQRLEFYRQLQELSDDVKPYKDELDPTLDLAALEVTTDKEELQKQSLAKLRTENRFLHHLQQDENGSEPKICVVCQSSFELGVLTSCGHQYCKECIGHWWQSHKTCPLCKRHLSAVDFHNISYKPQQLRAQEETHSGPASPGEAHSSPSSKQSSIYSDVDTQLMDQIKSVDLPSSYGTKIDTLGRHLHWIREHDPGAKSIVFSQYREFLDVLGTALADFKIGYRRLGRSNAAERFKNDPSVDCLLLDAKTDSSGLTLVNATHVFICEPLIQTAVELQAIARVHRIGQTRPTTVWMYLVNDTVEEAIYEISVARRMAHVQSREQQARKAQKSRAGTPAAAIDAAESEELQSKPLSKLLVAGKGGGELVGNDDLWQCLFGKAQRGGSAPGEEAERVVGRHLRAEAAEERRAVAGAERV